MYDPCEEIGFFSVGVRDAAVNQHIGFTFGCVQTDFFNWRDIGFGMVRVPSAGFPSFVFITFDKSGRDLKNAVYAVESFQ